jgi:tetratricopeptide (TPR) repeat protein
MLTAEERQLLQRHVTIDGDGNVVGNDNTVQVTKMDAETYVAEVKDQRVTFTVQDLRRIHVEDSQIGVIGDNTTVHGGINFIKKMATSPWAIGLLAVGVVLLSIVALANLPGAREQLPLWLQPRAFPKEREDEVLIVIAQFHTTEGVVDTAAHDEIKRAIEREAGDLNLRVEVAPTNLKADDREGAQTLGKKYDASIVIWGADTGVRVSVNFYNRKQPEADAANVQIEETTYTQIAAPSEYAEFVTQDLPRQLTFLALFAVGQSYYADEDYVESAQIIEKAIEALENQPDAIDGASEAYFRLGWLYYPLTTCGNNALDEAYAAYTNALELNAKDAQTYVNRGGTLLAMGDYEQALHDYDQALRLDSQDAFAYWGRATTYYALGQYEKALSDYAHVLNLDPDLAEVYRNRGVTYYQMGKYENALEEYNRALQLAPNLAEAYSNRGITYNEMGKHELALQNYTLALDLKPDLATAYYNQGATYYAMGKIEQAVGSYSRALELNSDLAEVYQHRGIAYAELGNYEDALTDFAQAINLNSQDARLYYNRGVTYYAANEIELALADFTHAIELDPQDGEAYYNLGVTYYELGEIEKALVNFVRATELMTHPVVYYNGAIAHTQLGHDEDACIWLEEAIHLASASRERARTDPDFDPIRDAPCFQDLMNSPQPSD